MAKIWYGPTVSDARGSVGGTTYTRTRRGQIMRARVTPKKNHSTAATYAKNCFKDCVNHYMTALLDSQRKAWQQFGLDYPTMTTIAGLKPLGPFQAFLRVNQSYYWYWNTFLDDPPPNLTVTQPGFLLINSATASPQHLTVTLGSGPTADEVVTFSCTGNISPARLSFRRWLKSMQDFAGPLVFPFELETYFNTYYGPLVAGKLVGLECWNFHSITGALSLHVAQSKIVS
jgi:hypothetical protein